jgi:hypothetical protein
MTENGYYVIYTLNIMATMAVFVHVQAEVRWPGSVRDPRADNDGWILAELILRGVELGQDPMAAPRGPDGKFVCA